MNTGNGGFPPDLATIASPAPHSGEESPHTFQILASRAYVRHEAEIDAVREALRGDPGPYRSTVDMFTGTIGPERREWFMAEEDREDARNEQVCSVMWERHLTS